MMEALIAGIGVMKYASIIVLSSIEKWKMLALLTLRQNIYTDPQVPMQVEQKIYKVGEATDKSPVIVTTNFSLTYFIVRGEIENSKVPCWLAILTLKAYLFYSMGSRQVQPAKIAAFVKESGIEKTVSHKEVIIPGYVAVLSGSLEEKLGEGWKVVVGPRRQMRCRVFKEQGGRNHITKKSISIIH